MSVKSKVIYAFPGFGRRGDPALELASLIPQALTRDAPPSLKHALIIALAIRPGPDTATQTAVHELLTSLIDTAPETAFEALFTLEQAAIRHRSTLNLDTNTFSVDTYGMMLAPAIFRHLPPPALPRCSAYLLGHLAFHGINALPFHHKPFDESLRQILACIEVHHPGEIARLEADLESSLTRSHLAAALHRLRHGRGRSILTPLIANFREIDLSETTDRMLTTARAPNTPDALRHALACILVMDPDPWEADADNVRSLANDAAKSDPVAAIRLLYAAHRASHANPSKEEQHYAVETFILPTVLPLLNRIPDHGLVECTARVIESLYIRAECDTPGDDIPNHLAAGRQLLARLVLLDPEEIERLRTELDRRMPSPLWSQVFNTALSATPVARRRRPTRKGRPGAAAPE